MSALIDGADRPLNVVQLHSSDRGGGAESIARLNHRMLQAMGHHSRLLVGNKLGTDVGVEEICKSHGMPGVKRIANFFESRLGLQYTYSPSFRRMVRELKSSVDVVHLHSLHGGQGWADLRGCRQLSRRFPLVMSLHDAWWMTGHCLHGVECERWKSGCGKCPDLERYPAIPKDGTALNFRRKAWLFKNSRMVCIAPSTWVLNQTRLSPILRATEVEVVANAIDTDCFHPVGRSEAKLQLGLHPDTRTILMVANHLNALKGADTFLRMIKELSEIDRITIVLIGHGSEKLALDLRIPCLSLGYISESARLAECYRAADLVIVPSKVETFGLVAVEAVACGAGVVSYHAGGLREVVESLSQVSVPDGDVQGLVDAAQRLLMDEPQRQHRVKRGQLYISAHYTPFVHTSACLNVYRKAIQMFRPPAGLGL